MNADEIRITKCFYNIITTKYNRLPIEEELDILEVLKVKVEERYLTDEQVHGLYIETMQLCAKFLEGKITEKELEQDRVRLEKKYFL